MTPKKHQPKHETRDTSATRNMNSLPPEMVLEILSHLPPSYHPTARLTSRLFNALLSPTTFPRLASFLDPAIAASLLDEGVREARARNVMSVWSPWCSVPRELPIPKSFLLAMYLALRSRQWVQGTASGSGESWESDSAISGMGDEETDAPDEELTAKKMADMLGRHDLREDVVRGAMFRYALYLSYIYGGEGQPPSLWVFDKELWETKL